MRIVLFTPVSHSAAIGRVSLLVSRALRDLGHEVVIIATDEVAQAEAEQVRDLGFIIHYTDEAAVYLALETADVIVHQIGDNYRFHVGSVTWLDRVGGIVCLHDYFLGGLFVNWSTRGNGPEAGRVLEQWYGRTLEWFHGMAQTGDIITGCWPAVTFVEWIASKADAVITHSDYGIQSVIASTGGAVAVVPLPYNLQFEVPSMTAASGPLRVLTFGAINPNKSADRVIRAIGSDEVLRSRVQYRLAGSIESAQRSSLSNLAISLGVDLVVLGPVSEAELARELGSAAAVACVRVPALESASASAIEAMLAARYVVVADTGFYASLPDDAVAKVRVNDPEPGIARAIRLAVDDPDAAAAIGTRAQRYASSTFSADNYARELLAMAVRVDRDRPRAEIVRSTAGILAQWGVASTSPLLAHSVALTEFFTPPQRPND